MPPRKVLMNRCFYAFFILIAFSVSCSRSRYREGADREVYAYLEEQSAHRQWAPESEFTIDPDSESRLHDPTDPDDPLLPDPEPKLYEYKIPDLSGIESLNDGLEPVEVNNVDTTPEEEGESENHSMLSADNRASSRIGALAIQPIPPSYWHDLPAGCVARMMEFASVREEYSKQFEKVEALSITERAERLSLRKIIQLARIESREYQSQKERLYQAALALTRLRFQYKPRLTANGASGNGNVTHRRSQGESVDSAGVNSGLSGGQMLSTGGDVMARLANDVVVTFNGPDGFSTDVGSTFLFELNQSLFQRDVRLNPLIQSERNMVYAARTYARFRKEFFEQLASQYYSLLQAFRSIEIESQNYFSLIRTFEQARAEVRSGVKNAPNQVAVDQFEQSMLSGRSGLIRRWNGLEQDLDRLKLTLGVPTETPLNIDLAELEQLTRLDEIEVAGERVRRWLSRVEDRLVNPRPDRSGILNASVFLITRLLEWIDLLKAIGWDAENTQSFETLLTEFQMESSQFVVTMMRDEMAANALSATRNPIILQFQETMDLNQSLLELAAFAVQFAKQKDLDEEMIQNATKLIASFGARITILFEELDIVLENPRREQLDGLLNKARIIQNDLELAVDDLESHFDPGKGELSEKDASVLTVSKTKKLIEDVKELLQSTRTGLLPININMDDAMATALVQRLDLMNQRGELADDWRLIKLAADDLKSVLNLNLTQTLNSRDNQPFAFSGEDSQTRLGLGFDLPVNRLQQRNQFRNALIQYQQGRRQLMEFEDNIKLDVRNRMRNMAETRLQYPISVTRAALAAEQVTSIRLQLALGIQGVRATDLLDALQDSRQALIDVANFRIGYIVTDASFAVDLESMELNALGFWDHINDPEFQHAKNLIYPESAGPVYGDIPPYLKVSKKIRRMTSSGKSDDSK